MRFVPFILALSAIAGCATEPAPATKVASAEPVGNADQTCRQERPTGSLMIKTVCEATVSDAARRAELDQYKDSIRNSTTSPSIGWVKGAQ